MPAMLTHTTTFDDSTKSAFVEANGQLLRALSPNRYSATEQAAEPEAQKTRLVKDVLRVGNWKVGFQSDGSPAFWNVTPATLREIVANFNLQRSRGIRHNFTFGHGDPQSKVVDPLSIISPIDQLVIVGETLFASCYVNAFEALTLRRDGMYVSVRCLPTWSDGQGREYTRSLLHVAVVDEPAVDSQGRFIQMANNPKGTRKMSMTFDVVISSIEALLPDGVTLPEGLTEENFDEMVPMFVSTLAQLGVADEATEVTDTSDTSQDQTPPDSAPADMPVEDLPANLANTPLGRIVRAQAARSKKLENLIADLSNAVKTVGNVAKTASKKEYTNRLLALGMKGVPAAQIASLQKMGVATNWDLSNLVPFENVAGTVDLSNQSRTLATPGAPQVGSRPAKSPERIAALRKFAGLPPEKK